MGLAYIFRRLTSEEGYSNIASNLEQRRRLLDIVNEACRYLWDSLETRAAELELTTDVTMGGELILPPYVGKLLAVRFTNTQDKWDVTSLRPRYSNTPWQERWNHFRVRQPTTLASRITTPTRLTFEMSDYTSSPEITIVGETATAHQVSESLTLASQQTTVNTYISNPTSIRKLSVCSSDITVRAADVTDTPVMGTFYNNMKYMLYQVYDVSKYPYANWGNLTYPVDILYRPPLPIMEEDGDEFPINGWDDFIVNKARQLILAKSPETFDAAAKLEADIALQIAAKLDKGREGERARIQTQENPLLSLDKHYNFPYTDRRAGSWYPQHNYYPA